jgi:hypothetical protein
MPLRFTDTQLNELFEEIPVLAGRPRQLEELSGGLTNRNVKVITPDAVYVARCVDTSSNPGHRCDEVLQHKAAEQAGVGAPVIDYRPDLGILLLGYLNERRCATTIFSGRSGGEGGCRLPALHDGPRFRGRLTCSNASPDT